MGSAEVRIVSVDDAPWDDVVRVFGERGDPSTCWCQFFKLERAGWESATRESCRNALQEQVRSLDPPPGVIAYRGDEAVGWCAVEPRDAYLRLTTAQVVTRGSDEPFGDPSVWAVTCFVVRVGHRRQGVATALLAGAVEQAERYGARVIEGYPVDTTRRSVSAAELYHGSIGLFVDAGFTITSRPTPARAVVTLRLEDSSPSARATEQRSSSR